MEGENVHLFKSTHRSICDTHPCRDCGEVQPAPLSGDGSDRSGHSFNILLIASPTKATLCKKINRWGKNHGGRMLWNAKVCHTKASVCFCHASLWEAPDDWLALAVRGALAFPCTCAKMDTLLMNCCVHVATTDAFRTAWRLCRLMRVGVNLYRENLMCFCSL